MTVPAESDDSPDRHDPVIPGSEPEPGRVAAWRRAAELIRAELRYPERAQGPRQAG